MTPTIFTKKGFSVVHNAGEKLYREGKEVRIYLRPDGLLDAKWVATDESQFDRTLGGNDTMEVLFDATYKSREDIFNATSDERIMSVYNGYTENLAAAAEGNEQAANQARMLFLVLYDCLDALLNDQYSDAAAIAHALAANRPIKVRPRDNGLITFFASEMEDGSRVIRGCFNHGMDPEQNRESNAGFPEDRAELEELIGTMLGDLDA